MRNMSAAVNIKNGGSEGSPPGWQSQPGQGRRCAIPRFRALVSERLLLPVLQRCPSPKVGAPKTDTFTAPARCVMIFLILRMLAYSNPTHFLKFPHKVETPIPDQGPIPDHLF